MYKTATPLFLICETSLHAGSGDDLGIVDLPIQRERHTGYPKIESSSLKGALREAFEEQTKGEKKFANWDDPEVKVQRVFGYDDGSLSDPSKEGLKTRFKFKIGDKEVEGNEFSGSIGFTDARLLLFPVKSMKGVFVWITCPHVLNRLEMDLKIAHAETALPSLKVASALPILENTCLVADPEKVAFNREHVFLEEYSFSAKKEAAVGALASELAEMIFIADDLKYWNQTLKTNLVILNDNDFRDFVTQSTEVVTRIKIDNNTGTVESGALFTEEYLPGDSVMYSLVLFSDEFTKRPSDKMDAGQVRAFFTGQMKKTPMFQLGGNATIGKGLLRTQLLND